MKRVTLWIVAVLFVCTVVLSAPGYSAVTVRPVFEDPNIATGSDTTIDPFNSGDEDGDDGDADSVAGIKDPLLGLTSPLTSTERVFILLKSWLAVTLRR